jgi:hypothetical protein
VRSSATSKTRDGPHQSAPPQQSPQSDERALTAQTYTYRTGVAGLPNLSGCLKQPLRENPEVGAVKRDPARIVDGGREVSSFPPQAASAIAALAIATPTEA